MEISDLDSGPLLQYFKKLESYLAELEQLEPMKPTRQVVPSSSTAAPPSTVIILSESLNDTDLVVNSTISSVEPSSAVNDSETNSGTVTIIVLGCCLAIVGIVIAVFVFGRRRFMSKAYSPASTREA
jgi:beta-lactamase regulating signal transducer with metallopeptidase domain